MSQNVAGYRETLEFFNRVLEHEPDKMKALMYLSYLAHFNFYRMFYPKLTFDDKRRLYEKYVEWFPDQEGLADVGFVLNCLRKIDSREPFLNVAELGGNEGGLARQVYHEHPNLLWTSFEITRHKIKRDIQSIYIEHVLAKELWETNINLSKVDVFISMHTLEHFSDAQVKMLIDFLTKWRVHYLIFQMPVQQEGQTWQNYYGAHVLEMGSNTFKELLSPNYRLLDEVPKGKHMHEGWCCFYEHKKG